MFLTIQVKGPTQEFKRRTTVVVKNQESLVFVQTDKPIYKPGQTGTKRPYSQNTSKKERPPPLHLPQSQSLQSWFFNSFVFFFFFLLAAKPDLRFLGFMENISVSVKFRIVSLDENFHPLNELVSLQVSIQNHYYLCKQSGSLFLVLGEDQGEEESGITSNDFWHYNSAMILI